MYNNKKLGILMVFIGIVILFLTLRFYSIEQHFAFAWDQENISQEVYRLLVDKKISLIGPRANNDLGFYLGPYFTLLIAPFFTLTHLHPSALIVFVIVNALAFIGLSYWIISKLFSQKIALYFLMLWGINIYLIQLDITAWWPVIIPIGTLLFLKLAHNGLRRRTSLYAILLGLLCGFFSNIHFQFIFITVISPGIFLLQKATIQRKLVYIGLFVFSFFIMLLPLFIFDLRHDFLNSINFFQFFFGKSHSQLGINMGAFIPVLLNVVETIFPFHNKITLSLLSIFLLILPLFLIKIQNNRLKKELWIIIFALYVVTIIGFIVYGKRPSEYYFLFLVPFFMLSLSVFGSFNSYTRGLFVLLIIWNGIAQFTRYQYMLTRPAHTYMTLKEKTVLEIKKYTDKRDVQISFSVPLGDDNGYRYFMKLHHVISSQNQRDPLIEVQIPPQKGTIVIGGDIGIKIPPELTL